MSTANTILSLQNENFSVAVVQFDGNYKKYSYKTTLELKEGERVIVDAPSTGLTTVTVVEVKDYTEQDMKLKWIVSKIDLTYYEKCKDVEKQLEAQLEKAKKLKMFRKLAEELGEDGMEAIKTMSRL